MLDIDEAGVAFFLQSVAFAALDLDPMDPDVREVGVKILAEVQYSPRFTMVAENLWSGVDQSKES